MLPDRRFRPEPMRAAEAIAWLQTHPYIWYQAPMDHSPCKVWLTSKLKLWKRSPERFSIGVETHASNRFRIDEGHLDRLRWPFELWHHGITATVSHVDYVGSPHQIVVHQSNGFHLQMTKLSHAIAFAKHSAIELTVKRWCNGKLKVRTLVPAHPPVSGELNF